MARKVALVSGASKGLGAATARVLALRGFEVAVNYHSDAAGAAAVARQIAEETTIFPLTVRADVTVESDVTRLVSAVLGEYGRLDVLVSNAALPYVQKPMIEMSLQEFELKLHAEMRAAFLLTQAVLPGMTAHGGGRLIYISSDHALGPSAPGMISHGTSKAALTTFAKYMAHEVGRRHITANVVQCGIMDTHAIAHLPDEFREAITARIPLGYIAQAADVAAAVAFFASDDSRFVTGTVLPANGGIGLSQFCLPDPAPLDHAENI